MPTVGKLQEEKTEQAIKELEGFEEKLYNKLVVYLASITNNGRLQATPAQLAELNNKIVNWTKELGYGKIVDTYLSALDEVDEINRKYYDSQVSQRVKNRIENEIIRSPANTEYRKQVSDNLRAQGAKSAIVDKIDEALRLQAIRGSTFGEAAATLKELVTKTSKGGGIADRHFMQVSRDAIMQYDGIIQEKLYNVFKPTKGRYLASIIETSRPICDHIKDNYANRLITIPQLQVVLDEFCPNGIPSAVEIEYTTVTGKPIIAKKGDGMILNTTIDNFQILRGGYNCRHEWKWDFSTVE